MKQQMTHSSSLLNEYPKFSPCSGKGRKYQNLQSQPPSNSSISLCFLAIFHSSLKMFISTFRQEGPRIDITYGCSAILCEPCMADAKLRHIEDIYESLTTSRAHRIIPLPIFCLFDFRNRHQYHALISFQRLPSHHLSDWNTLPKISLSQEAG
jgi:hypothetical protein